MHLQNRCKLGASLVGLLLCHRSWPVAVTSRWTARASRLKCRPGWALGHKDLDNLFMIFFKDSKSGAVLEGVGTCVARRTPSSRLRISRRHADQQNKAYEGKHHKVAKEGDTTMGGAKGNYILTTWKRGRQEHGEPHRPTPQRRPALHGRDVGREGQGGQEGVRQRGCVTFALAK